MKHLSAARMHLRMLDSLQGIRIVKWVSPSSRFFYRNGFSIIFREPQLFANHFSSSIIEGDKPFTNNVRFAHCSPDIIDADFQGPRHCLLEQHMGLSILKEQFEICIDQHLLHEEPNWSRTKEVWVKYKRINMGCLVTACSYEKVISYIYTVKCGNKKILGPCSHTDPDS